MPRNVHRSVIYQDMEHPKYPSTDEEIKKMSYIYVCVCVCVFVYIYIYIYTHTRTHNGILLSHKKE